MVNNGTNKYVLVGATSFGVSTCEGPYPAMFARLQPVEKVLETKKNDQIMKLRNYEIWFDPNVYFFQGVYFSGVYLCSYGACPYGISDQLQNPT